MLEEPVAHSKRKRKAKPRKKNDILLKGAVEDFFPYVLRFFYPNADEVFDIDKGFEWMNTELHEIQPMLSQKGGSRAADVLVKVHLMNGSTDQYSFNLLGTELNFKYNTYQIFSHSEEVLLEMDNPFAFVIIAAQQEALYNDKKQDGLLNTRVKIVRSMAASEKFNHQQIREFLYFMDQFIPLTDKGLKCIFDQELTKLFGGNITMGIMEAVREQILDEGFEKGEVKKSHAVVENLIVKLGLSNEQAADIAEVSVAFVKEVRGGLEAKK